MSNNYNVDSSSSDGDEDLKFEDTANIAQESSDAATIDDQPQNHKIDIEEPFSLGKLLGLESVKRPDTMAPSVKMTPFTDSTMVLKEQRISLTPRDVLFPLEKINKISASEGALCRRCNEEESNALWSKSRAVLRSELKSRLRLLSRKNASGHLVHE